MKVDELENREYPLGIKAAQVFVTGGTLLIFFAVLYWSLHAWGIFLSQFGSYEVSLSSQRLPYGRSTFVCMQLQHRLHVLASVHFGLDHDSSSCHHVVIEVTCRVHNNERVQAIVSALMALWSSISIGLAFKRVRLPLKSATIDGGATRSIANGVD